MVRHRLSIGQKIWVLRRTFKPRGNGGALARLSSPWWCSSLPPKEVGAKMRVASTCLDGHRKLPEMRRDATLPRPAIGCRDSEAGQVRGGLVRL
jgi:hypothetical protein